MVLEGAKHSKPPNPKVGFPLLCFMSNSIKSILNIVI